MKKWMFMCLFVIFCTVACNTAMRDGAKPVALKAGMPNTITLPSREVAYDLSGEWETSMSSVAGSRSGVIKITQEGDQFVGVAIGGNFVHISENGELVKGKVQGATLTDVYLYTWQG